MPVLIFVFCLVFAGTAAADGDRRPMSLSEFEAFVTGKTLLYGDAVGAFGVEEYRENRRVRWSYLDGECTEGVWFPVGEQICFQYDNIAEKQCWTFFLDRGRLEARFENDPGAAPVYQTREADEPMECLGPRIGV